MFVKDTTSTFLENLNNSKENWTENGRDFPTSIPINQAFYFFENNSRKLETGRIQISKKLYSQNRKCV